MNRLPFTGFNAMSASPAVQKNPNTRSAAALDYLLGALRGEFSRERFLPEYWRAFLVSLLPWTLIEMLVVAQEISFRLYRSEAIDLPDAWVWCVRVALSAALTPLVFWAGARWPIERQVWKDRLALHFGVAFGFGIVRPVLELAVFFPPLLAGYNVLELPLDDLRWAVGNVLIYGFYSAFLRYWVFLSLQAAFLYYEKFRERERAAARLELHASELRAQIAHARLEALKMQLQPHFLFNTLNAIVVLVRQGEQRQAEQALTRLSDLLRAVLDDHEAQYVPLRRELEYLRLYLSIEQMRFSDRLDVKIEADPEVLEAAVPQMVLQPIVENAVRHGISRRTAKGTIEIQATSEDDILRIVVKDNGPGIASVTPAESHGVGLSNLRARLQQLYGSEASLSIQSSRTHGTEVTLTLPDRARAAPEQGVAFTSAFA